MGNGGWHCFLSSLGVAFLWAGGMQRCPWTVIYAVTIYWNDVSISYRNVFFAGFKSRLGWPIMLPCFIHKNRPLGLREGGGTCPEKNGHLLCFEVLWRTFRVYVCLVSRTFNIYVLFPVTSCSLLQNDADRDTRVVQQKG